MLILDAVQLLSQGAVHVEPPVADEVLLVEDCSIGTQERVGDQVAVDVTQGTEVERLQDARSVNIGHNCFPK